MNGEELGQLLTLISGYDDRFLNPDTATMGAWSRALRKEELADCVPPVDAWFAKPRERRIMTGDVAEPAKLARQRRIAFTQEEERHQKYRAAEAQISESDAAANRAALHELVSGLAESAGIPAEEEESDGKPLGPEHTPVEDPLEVAARYDGRKITPGLRADWKERIPLRINRRLCAEAIDNYYRNRATRDTPIRILDVLMGVEAIVNQRIAQRRKEERDDYLNPQVDVSPVATLARIAEIRAAESRLRRDMVKQTMAARERVQAERLAYFSQLTASSQSEAG